MGAIEDLDTYNAQIAHLPAEAFLGYFVHYKVGNVHFPHADVVTAATKYGLQDAVPHFPADVDVFRNAFRQGQRRAADVIRFDPTTGTNRRIIQRMLVRDVNNSSERCIRRIVVEEVDKTDESLKYHGSWQALYEFGVLTTTELEPNSVGRELIEVMEREYYSTRSHINGKNMTNFVTRVLAKCSAISLADGLVFVPMEHEATLHALEECVGCLSPIVVRGFQLLNSHKDRTFIAHSAAADLEVEAVALEGRLQAKIAEGKVGKLAHGTLAQEVAELEEKGTEYAQLLKDETLGIKVRISTLRMQLATLGDCIVKRGQS